MKRVRIKITIDTGDRFEEMQMEKHGPDDEMETLAGAVSSIFLKSKDALEITRRKGSRALPRPRTGKK